MSQQLVVVTVRLSVNGKYIVDPGFHSTPDAPTPTPGENQPPPLPAGTYVFDTLELALGFVKSAFEGSPAKPA